MRALPFVVVVVGIAGAACGDRVPVPPRTGHEREVPSAVAFPPPPARVEIVPTPPKEMKDPVWVDGEWQWKGRRWVWQPGQWTVPYPGWSYAPPKTVRLSDGTLAWYPGSWRKNAAQSETSQ